MRYAKGTYVITPERDIPLLRHVRNARAVSHQQLFKLLELDGLGSCRSTFNWRVRRLIETGHLRWLDALNWLGFPIYFITSWGLAEIEDQGECLLAMHSGNRQHADRARIPHAPQLVEVRLALARHSGRVFTRDQILNAVWRETTFVSPRSVDVYVRKLREKIESDPERPRYLKTVRGAGYRFEAPK